MEHDYEARYKLYKKLPFISAILTFVCFAVFSFFIGKLLIGCILGAVVAVSEWFILSLAIAPIIVQTDTILSIRKELSNKGTSNSDVFKSINQKINQTKSEPAVKEGQSEQYYRDLFKYGKISSSDLKEQLDKIKMRKEAHSNSAENE